MKQTTTKAAKAPAPSFTVGQAVAFKYANRRGEFAGTGKVAAAPNDVGRVEVTVDKPAAGAAASLKLWPSQLQAA